MATACWCCCVYDLSPPTSYPHAPPPQWMTKKKKNPLFNQQWQSLTQIALRRQHGGLVRFTEAPGKHDGKKGKKKKVPQARLGPKHDAAGCHTEHLSGCRALSPLLQMAIWQGEKKTWLIAIARGFNKRLCGLWWDGLRVSYLLSNTDPLPTEVWPIYWLPNSDFLRSVRARFRNKKFTRPEKFISGTAKVICWTGL